MRDSLDMGEIDPTKDYKSCELGESITKEQLEVNQSLRAKKFDEWLEVEE